MADVDHTPKAVHAVIIGGGIAGLTAAIALSPHFEEISIVERDAYPESPLSRSHTPQGAHVHILLAKGLSVLSDLVPEFPVWLNEMGLREGDLTWDVLLRYGDDWLPRTTSGIPIRPCTRPVVEHLLLRAVRERPNVRILANTRAIGIIGQDKVTGVRVHDALGRDDILHCDWTVDAGGRSSRILDWLESSGFGGVPVETVDAGVTYSSCAFSPPADADANWMFVGNLPKFPDVPRATALMRIHDGNWLGAVVGYRGLPPPRSTEEMVEMICHHLAPPYSDYLRMARPLTKIVHFTKTANRRRRFSRMKRWPDRLAVLGDAACVLNPRYGQGMTVATLGAKTMALELRKHTLRHGTLDGLAPRFQRALDNALDVPWRLALMEDRLWEAIREQRRVNYIGKLTARMSRRMLETVFSDMEIYIQFMRVAHMLDSPLRLLNWKTISGFAAPSRGPRNRV